MEDALSQLELSTIIMAGGKSSRMGTDKSFVPLLGKPMIEHVIESLEGIGDETIIITNRAEKYRYLGLPLFGDVFPDHGPLGGLHAGLHYAKHLYALVVACDMPWLNRRLLNYMVSLRESADAIVPRWIKHPEPLHAIYSKNCLGPIEESLRTKRLKVISFYSRIEVRFLNRETIEQFDPKGMSFANVNTPDDLINAQNQAW